jgi:hypothetical protein
MLVHFVWRHPQSVCDLRPADPFRCAALAAGAVHHRRRVARAAHGGIAADAFNKQSQRAEGQAALAAEAAGQALTDRQKTAKTDWTRLLEQQAPTRQKMQEEVNGTAADTSER